MIVSLQWGRGCLAAESMYLDIGLPPQKLLQWGRGCLAAERIEMVVDLNGDAWLQWGRGCLAAESGLVKSVSQSVPASMGPRLFSRGKQR